MGGGEIVKVDLGICREIDRYTCMYALEANKARKKDIERDASRRWREAYYIEGEGVCEYEINEKSGGSEAWTVRREEGKLVFVVGTPG